jgi:hypothetical protein
MIAHVLAYAIFLVSLFLFVLSNNDFNNEKSTFATVMQLLFSILFTISQGFFIYIFN